MLTQERRAELYADPAPAPPLLEVLDRAARELLRPADRKGLVSEVTTMLGMRPSAPLAERRSPLCQRRRRLISHGGRSRWSRWMLLWTGTHCRAAAALTASGHRRFCVVGRLQGKARAHAAQPQRVHIQTSGIIKH